MRQGEERAQEGDGGQEGAPHGAAHCSVLTVSYSQFELFYLDLHILSVTCEHWDVLRSWESLEIVRPTIVTFHLHKLVYTLSPNIEVLDCISTTFSQLESN